MEYKTFLKAEKRSQCCRQTSGLTLHVHSNKQASRLLRAPVQGMQHSDSAVLHSGPGSGPDSKGKQILQSQLQPSVSGQYLEWQQGCKLGKRMAMFRRNRHGKGRDSWEALLVLLLSKAYHKETNNHQTTKTQNRTRGTGQGRKSREMFLAKPFGNTEKHAVV